MNRHDFPSYLKGIEAYLANDRRTLLRLIRNPAISLEQRNLLRARFLMRRAQHDRARVILEGLKTSLAFFEGERNVLLGAFWFFKGDFEQAAISNQIALQNYHACADRRGQFIAAYNIGVDFERIGALKLSRHFISIAHQHASGPQETCILLRAEACELALAARYLDAAVKIERALSMIDSLSVNDRSALLTVGADVFFKADQPQRARTLLEELKEVNVHHHNRARMEFELRVLKALIDGDRIKDWRLGAIESSDEYRLKWDILHSAQTGDRERIQVLWRSLVEMCPGIFGDSFSCAIEAERKSIFYTYFRRLHAETASHKLATEGLKGQVLKLHEILMASSLPRRKEDLIEEIWGCLYSPEYDARFYKLVERLKKTSILPIVVQNRAYAYARTGSQKVR